MDKGAQAEPVSDLHKDLPRGRSPQFVGMPPQAYFEPTENLLATRSLRMAEGNAQSKLLLGVLGGRVVAQETSDRVTRHVIGGQPVGMSDDRHHFVLAGSRGGKGRAFLIPNLFLLPASTSIFAIDPKGELTRATAEWRARGLGQIVYVLDPAGAIGELAKNYACSFNPLAAIANQDRMRWVPAACLLADALVIQEQNRDPHWDQTSAAFLSALVLHVLTCPRYAQCCDLVTVRKLIMHATQCEDHQVRPWLEREMKANDTACGGYIANAAIDLYDKPPSEFGSVLSNLRKHTAFLEFDFMQSVLSGTSTSIDLRNLKRKSMALYAVVRVSDLAALRGWLRLLVQFVLSAFEEETNMQGAQAVAFLDEFHVLGHMRQIEMAAAQIAGLGLKLVPVLQDLNQLKSIYPQSWETFVGNSGCIQCFAMVDATTCEYVSRLLGSTMTVNHSSQSPTFDQSSKRGATGESWSTACHALLAPDEVNRFFARDDHLMRQLIIRPGYRPAILQRCFYDKHELFQGKHGSFT